MDLCVGRECSRDDPRWSKYERNRRRSQSPRRNRRSSSPRMLHLCCWELQMCVIKLVYIQYLCEIQFQLTLSSTLINAMSQHKLLAARSIVTHVPDPCCAIARSTGKQIVHWIPCANELERCEFGDEIKSRRDAKCNQNLQLQTRDLSRLSPCSEQSQQSYRQCSRS